jgi:galactokinase/mevalonate kinase-like predicted kinase
MAHINVGIEPSDITIFMRAFYGADINHQISRYLNYHIRSDTQNKLLLRTKMTKADIELISDVARGNQREATQALRQKIMLESIYKNVRSRVEENYRHGHTYLFN